MKNAIRLTLIALICAGGYWLWHVLFPGDEALIRRQLLGAAQAASFSANEAPIAKLSNAAKLAGYFAPDADINLDLWDYRPVHVQGRDEIQQAVLAARGAMTTLDVQLTNIEITLGPGSDNATARMTMITRGPQVPESQPQQFELGVRKIDGKWLIQRAKTFDYLKP
ncbi:hypothetical protein GC207_11830 [bacterium]|nr:hypothetical protein [bacterium]